MSPRAPRCAWSRATRAETAPAAAPLHEARGRQRWSCFQGEHRIGSRPTRPSAPAQPSGALVPPLPSPARLSQRIPASRARGGVVLPSPPRRRGGRGKVCLAGSGFPVLASRRAALTAGSGVSLLHGAMNRVPRAPALPRRRPRLERVRLRVSGRRQLHRRYTGRS
jgi:hypothetical protein